MSRNLLLFFIIITFLSVRCRHEERNSCYIEIQVPPGEFDSISYYLSRDGFMASSLWGFHSAYFDSSGVLRLNLISNEINGLVINYYNSLYSDKETKFKYHQRMLIRQGDNYEINYSKKYTLPFRVEGELEDAQNLYNDFCHKRFNYYHITDTLPEKLFKILNDSIQSDLDPFLNLMSMGKLDNELFQAIRSIIRYNHVSRFLSQIERRQLLISHPEWKKYYPDLHPLEFSEEANNKFYNGIFKEYPVDDPKVKLYGNYGFYIDDFVRFKSLEDSTFNFQNHSIENKIKSADFIRKHLNEELSEFYFAYHFTYWSIKDEPDSIAMMYRNFKDMYPKSRWLKGVSRSVARQAGFYTTFYPNNDIPYNTSDKDPISKSLIFSAETKIINDIDSITSFDSLLNRFRGKNLLINFWASWCPPCRYEFKFSDSLYSFLTDNNFEMIYISSDINENRWLGTINQYNLKGNHFRVTNESLKREIRELIYFIPTYMIVDSSGNIVVQDAEKPHTKSILYKQLIESTN